MKLPKKKKPVEPKVYSHTQEEAELILCLLDSKAKACQENQELADTLKEKWQKSYDNKFKPMEAPPENQDESEEE